ncbi:MAG: HTTM domain-containing protein [Bacteroidota bacterium]
MKLLFSAADSRVTALIRILSGVWFFVDTLSMLVSGYVTEAYVNVKVNLSFYGFEWVQPLSGAGMYVLFLLLILFSIAIAIGYRTKLFLSLFIIGFSYVFLIDVVYTLNKFYLFLIIAFLVLFSDESPSWKYPQLKKVSALPVAYWNIFIFQALIGVIYFYSGIAKINHDWLYHAEPLHSFFRARSYIRALGADGLETLSFIFSYCGILFDLSIAFILINRRTRVWGQVAQIAFHLLNFTILHIGSLSIFMILFTFFLFPTEWLKRKMSLKELEHNPKWSARIPSGLYLAGIVLGLQLIIPHRHYFSNANVNWTEKGHRFSWRLMSRTKGGSYSSFEVVDNETKESWNINPRAYLTGRQYRKMSAESDLILFFAHFLAREWKEKGHKDVSVYVNSRTHLNHRHSAPLIDREIDLVKVPRTFIVDRISLPIADCQAY